MKSKSKVTQKSNSQEPAKSGKRLPPELRQLEEIVGQFIEYWGFKRIHGRIWAHLYTSDQPLDSQELMGRLKVSKGLMSIAIRDLIEFQVIEEAYVGKHGTVFYKANQDLMGVISNVLRTREVPMLGTTQITVESLLNLNPVELKEAGISAEKLNNVLNLTRSAQALLAAFLNKGGSEQGSLFAPLL